MDRNNGRRQGWIAVALGVGLIAAAGCSSDDDDDGAAEVATSTPTTDAAASATTGDTAVASTAGSTAGPSATTGGGGFPVTIEHKYGETTITEQPERVVTVGFADQDALLALGVMPVGIRDWYGEQPFATWPWATDALGDGRADGPAVDGAELRADQRPRSRPHRRHLVGNDRRGVRHPVEDRADGRPVRRLHRLRGAVAGGDARHRRGHRPPQRGRGARRRRRGGDPAGRRRPPGVGGPRGRRRLRAHRDGDRRLCQRRRQGPADRVARLRDPTGVRRARR